MFGDTTPPPHSETKFDLKNTLIAPYCSSLVLSWGRNAVMPAPLLGSQQQSLIL